MIDIGGPFQILIDEKQESKDQSRQEQGINDSIKNQFEINTQESPQRASVKPIL